MSRAALEGQDEFDEVFERIVAIEATLDEVIESLKDCGIKVSQQDRVVVSKWLDVFDVRLPIRLRLAVLRGWLESARRFGWRREVG